MNLKNHWERVYTSNSTEKLGWYKPHLKVSLEWIEGLDLNKDFRIIDVGGGASSLVDDLLRLGYRSITVLDISKNALDLAKRRLQEKADQVTWLAMNICSADLPIQGYELWHDRAVFHFLTQEGDRKKYLDNLYLSVMPGGYLIMAVFAPEAPPKCSGLPVQRYNLDDLIQEIGEGFTLMRHQKELHVTPGGVEQMYLYCLFNRRL